MTCERQYTTQVCADLQRIAAEVEVEKRRQYRAEMAQELRQKVAVVVDDHKRSSGEWHQGVVATLAMLESWLDELSPPTTCDSN